MRSHSLLDQAWTITLLSATLCFACVAEDADPDDGMGGSSAGGAAPAAGGASAGAGGAAAPVDGTGIDCSSPTPVNAALITDFESYAGEAVKDAVFTFNSNAEGLGTISLGVFAVDDMTGSYTLDFVPGAGGSAYAVNVHNPAASAWGGAIGIWHGCMDASAFTGIQFMAKGSTPATTADISIEMSSTESVTTKFDVPADWALVQLPFAGFANEKMPALKLDGGRIGAIAFGTHLIWMPSAADPDTWVPSEGEIDLTIDELSFY